VKRDRVRPKMRRNQKNLAAAGRQAGSQGWQGMIQGIRKRRGMQAD
jgi:hypothetical protein